jgi:hypothetical protein
MFAPSVVIGDLNVESISFTPHEADSPLVVDPDAVLSLAISLQLFQPISRWDSQVLERDRAVQQQQLSPRHSLEGPKARHVPIVKELFGVRRAERANRPVAIIPFNGKRNKGPALGAAWTWWKSLRLR